MPLLYHSYSLRPNGKSFAAPISNLPQELLSRIFELGTPNDGRKVQIQDFAHYWKGFEYFGHGTLPDHNEDRGIGINVSNTVTQEADQANGEPSGHHHHETILPPFQTVLCRVSHYWRDVAFATPSLWTLIAISPHARPPYKHVSTLLQRSKALPVDIHIDFGLYDYDTQYFLEGDDELSRTDARLLYSLLVPHLHRWRSIQMRFSLYQHVYEFLDSVSNPTISAAPQLKALTLIKRDSTDDSIRSWDVSLLNHFTLFGGSVPSIEYLNLDGVHFDWNQPWITTSSTLTTLELADHRDDVRPCWAQFATMLRGVPQLQTLKLLSSGPFGEPADWVEPNGSTHVPIHLPNLMCLAIGFQASAHAVELLRRLSMPALKCLTLEFDDEDCTDLVRQLAGPATSLQPPIPDTDNPSRSLLSGLETVDIASLPCTREGMAMFLGELQNLKELKLELYYSMFLRILCHPCTLPGYDVWLPRLETLSVSGISKKYRFIRNVVQKRKDAGVPIKSLRLHAPDIDDKTRTWLTNNVESVFLLEDVWQTLQSDHTDHHGYLFTQT